MDFSESDSSCCHDNQFDKRKHCDCIYGGQCWVAVIILLIVGIVIILGYYWVANYLKKNNVSSSEGIGKLLASVPGKGATFWEFTHLILYGILGFFFPTCDAVIISIAAAWELVEHYMSLTTKPLRRPSTSGGYVETQWWYGSATDIVVDIFGFYVGKSFRLLMLPPSPKNCNNNFNKCHNNCENDSDDEYRCDGYHNTRGNEQFNLLYFR